jgi:hypothetical protein
LFYFFLGFLNDLWRFDGTYWTWISGSEFKNKYGIYGVQGTSSIDTAPGGRRDAVSWIDSNNNFYLFGGQGLASSGTVGRINLKPI